MSTDEHATFRQEVAKFLNLYWYKSEGLPEHVRVQKFRQALVAQGWSTPKWPVAYGGLGWDAAQLYIWFGACAQAGVACLYDVGCQIVAPLIFTQIGASNPAPQQLDWLQQMQAFQERWAVGYLEPGFAGIAALYDTDSTDADNADTHDAAGQSSAHDVGTILVEQLAEQMVSEARLEKAYVADDTAMLSLSGCKICPVETYELRWLCCLVRFTQDRQSQLAWVAIDLQCLDTDLQVEERTGSAGEKILYVQFQNLRMPRDHLLGVLDHHVDILAPASLLERVLFQSIEVKQQLDFVAELIQDFAQDDVVHQQHAELGVMLAGLEALEGRFRSAQIAGEPPPFPLPTLALRGHQIFTQLGDLLMQSFGYYALPYLDEMLSHNEDAVGPPGVATAIGRAMNYSSAMINDEFGLSASVVRDQLAERIVFGKSAKVARK